MAIDAYSSLVKHCYLGLQLLLLTKAVLVALYGQDDVFPDRQSSTVGLAFMFCSIIGSALFVLLETLMVVQFVTGAQLPLLDLWLH